MQEAQILVIDLGSQYTTVIERTCGELGVRVEVQSPKEAEDWLDRNTPRGIILSGGAASVTDQNAPSPPRRILTLGVPILGICYGMQWLAQELGGDVKSETTQREYGEAQIKFLSGNRGADPLFRGIKGTRGITKVWASHGDTVTRLPHGMLATSTQRGSKTPASMHDPDRRIWGVQFHPEVAETPKGEHILGNFLFTICNCIKDRESWEIITEIQRDVREAVGEQRVVGAFSGGVDSATLFAVLAPVLKDRLFAVCVDAGQFREGEMREIRTNASIVGANLVVLDAQESLEGLIEGVTDAEQKRKIFQRVYEDALTQMGRRLGAQFLLQGTLSPDRIESGDLGESAHIKTHHNVGVHTDFELLHPFDRLFKYQVREVARSLDLPSSITERKPFPGPGLLIRILGAPPISERIAIVRWADAQVTRILQEGGIYEELSQLIVALLCVPTVGIKGDGRVYGPSIVIRAVQTTDFMTAKGYYFPEEIWRILEARLTQHPDIVRVLMDSTNKPPGTAEFE